MVVDPIVIAAEIVPALQTVVARSVDPAEPAVVSCTDASGATCPRPTWRRPAACSTRS
ncbi:hypothetical protein ACPPVO_30795 [Dactylosporangium sp. McL0621]|uniref:hypothetical protein n=1 Tax=Dactylosporangium sp. McL0621 TaxID=3415678 RepID=UPI003CE84A5E